MRSPEENGAFVQAMLWECSLEDYALLCKTCHKCKSYAEAQGISLERARAEKTAIRLQKEKQDVQWLKENGIIPASNSAKRRVQIVERLMEEKENE